ncbi:UDP-N-acetylglucosamine 1-carboxyvinyltransferase [Erysipelotrichaceae bacterium]|nr:UDP-N-acetylglucosamine 1-carboxyvinyltransferase [Erysipelotrichaceae bacterium]
MDTLKVTGGTKLAGDVFIHGSKNAALPILAATLLFDDASLILDCIPKIKDVELMIELLEKNGLTVERTKEQLQIKIPENAEIISCAPDRLTSKMRATLMVLGPLLAIGKDVAIALPGGCSIGYRPIDMHIAALEAMGAEIELVHGRIFAKAPNRLKPALITLDYPSVGATENIIMAAVLTKGTTRIRNAAKEPEVTDLVRFLNQAGAKISGAGTSELEIEGVTQLKQKVVYEIIPDRIEAATFMIAAAVTGGEIRIHHTIPKHLESLIAKLREIGVEITIQDDTIVVNGKNSYQTKQSIDIKTGPYPGFQTDIQALILPLLMKNKITSVTIDNVFDQRFRHVPEFLKIGANITQINNMLIINQTEKIYSGKVEAPDVRAAAALILLGLSENITIEITQIDHLYRGYENLVEQLNALGATITSTKK